MKLLIKKNKYSLESKIKQTVYDSIFPSLIEIESPQQIINSSQPFTNA
jgi:hypothetical protein